MERILACELSGQIASNQHCFVSLPFPLGSGNREASTPTFAWDDGRVVAIAGVVDEALVQLGFTEEERSDMKARANVIDFLPRGRARVLLGGRGRGAAQ